MEDKIFYKEYQLELLDLETDLAEAAITKNSQFNYAKFILTDDQPNANNQRVPQDEFANLIATGHFAPLKMALGKINDGHDQSIPLGVITHLKEEGNQVKGLAALWTRERPQDVEFIKKAYAEKKPINLSWEIQYADSVLGDDGIEELHGTSLRAATIVGLPAYQGRTPIFAVASEQNKSNMEDTTLDENEKLTAELKDTQTQLEEAQKKLTELETELTTLREFKASIDAETEKAQKLAALKQKFESAGLKKEDSYFETNKETLLSLTAEALEFMIQEMISFASASNGNHEDKKNEVPPIIGAEDEEDYSDPKVLAGAIVKELRSRNKR